MILRIILKTQMIMKMRIVIKIKLILRIILNRGGSLAPRGVPSKRRRVPLSTRPSESLVGGLAAIAPNPRDRHRDRKILRRGDLEIPLVPLDQRDLLAQALDEHRIVGRAVESVLRVRPPEKFEAIELWRLDPEEPASIHGLAHRASRHLMTGCGDIVSIVAATEAARELAEVDAQWPQIATNYEAKYRAQGKPIHRRVFAKTNQ